MNNQPILEIDNFGTKRWFLNYKLHREDGPAVIYPDGFQQWYQYGKLHRVDGPAIETFLVVKWY
jgi:hypothetical protein